MTLQNDNCADFRLQTVQQEYDTGGSGNLSLMVFLTQNLCFILNKRGL